MTCTEHLSAVSMDAPTLKRCSTGLENIFLLTPFRSRDRSTTPDDLDLRSKTSKKNSALQPGKTRSKPGDTFILYHIRNTQAVSVASLDRSVQPNEHVFQL